MKTISLSFLLITSSLLSCFSQGVSTSETIVYINGKFSSKFQVRVEEEREMLIDFYRGAEIYRTDRVYLPTLDHQKIKFNSEEKSIALYCLNEMPKEYKKFMDGCVERTFHNKGLRKHYARINLPVGTDQKTINGLITAFNHLIQISIDEGDYMGVDSFE